MRLILAVLAAAASAGPGDWTFCVAEAGEDIWISDVFHAAHNRERLEAEFTAMLRTRGVNRADVQCPQPQPDKTEALNAQFTAAEFQRKLGRRLRAVTFSAGGR